MGAQASLPALLRAKAIHRRQAGRDACAPRTALPECPHVRRQLMASWQADVVSTLIRMIVKRRPEGSEADVVKHIRSRLELSEFIRSLITSVDAQAVRAVRDGSVKG